MSFVRNAASVLLTSFAAVPIGIITSIVLARFLSVPDRGLYSVITTTTTILVLIAQLGWPTALIYRLRRAGSTPAHVASMAAVAALGNAALVVVACLLLRSEILRHFLQDAPALALYIALATVPLQLVGLVFSGVARGIDRFSLHNGYQLFLSLGLLVVMSVALGILRSGFLGAVVALLALHASAALFAFVSVARHTGLSARIDWAGMWESLRFGVKSWIPALAGAFHEHLVVFLLASLRQDAAEIAVYAIAAGLLRQLPVISASIGLALYPRLAGEGETRAGALASRVSRHAFTWVLLAGLGLAVVGPYLIPLLYGEAYEASVLPFLVLLPGVVLRSIYQVLSRYFTAVGRQNVNVVSQLLAAVLNVGLNLALIPRYGVMGAAIAGLISYSLQALIITVAFSSDSGQGLVETLVFQRGDIADYRGRIGALATRLRRSR
ncbi:MAG: oligosaccharide flippase family protein [Myxococcota bacterium]|nr:oligosaccharide flippase family protein [Myxococcota bacterium]